MHRSAPFFKSFSVMYAPTEADIAAKLNISVSHMQKYPLKSEARIWTGLNLAQAHFANLIATTPNIPLVSIRSTWNPYKVPQDGIAAWSLQTFTNIESVAMFYERTVAPAVKITKEIKDLELESFGLKDILRLKKLPITALEKKKIQLGQVTQDLADRKKERADYVAASFTTEIYNALINLFRLCGQKDQHAHRYAVQLLDDMSAFGVPYDEATKLLMKKICFNDEPSEDSEMLFAFVEVPELGEVSLKSEGKSVELMNESATKIAADRANLPLSEEGRYLTGQASHPNLIESST